MVVAATAVIALVIVSSGPTSLMAHGAAKAQSADSAQTGAASQAATLQKARGMIASMPTYFEVNRGQTDPSVRYLSRSGRYSMDVSPSNCLSLCRERSTLFLERRVRDPS